MGHDHPQRLSHPQSVGRLLFNVLAMVAEIESDLTDISAPRIFERARLLIENLLPPSDPAR
jgi:hypothetical protein